MVCTACASAFAQTRVQRLPVGPPDFARFQSEEAFTDGNGVFMRWQMERETGNLGFLVYRITGHGLEPVGDGIVQMSSGTSPARPEYGARYEFFDPQGSLGTAYAIVSRAVDGRQIQSPTFTPRFSNDLQADTGYTHEFMIQHAEWRGGRLTNGQPALNRELTAMVNASRPAPNPEVQHWTVTQPGVKIAVDREGLYRVTRAELEAAGFPVNSDSSTWRLFMNGNEQSILVGDGDQYIEFYGRGLDTYETDKRIYYLVQDTVAGKRMLSKLINSIGGNVVSNNYRYDTVYKERISYNPAILNGDNDNYFGNAITSTARTVSVSLSSVDASGPDALMQVNLVGLNNGPHNVRIQINGVDAGVLTGYGLYIQYGGTFVVPASLLHDGANSITLNTLVSSDANYFDSIKVNYSRKYAADQSSVRFFTPGYRRMNVTGFTSPNVRVFDTTRDGDPQLITDLPIIQDGSTFTVRMPSNRPAVFYAVEDSALLHASSVTYDNPSSLASTDNGADLVIISSSAPDMLAASEAWANYRRGRTGGQFNVKVVDVEDIYDEFSYGTHTGQAIKDFLRYAYNNWQSQRPGYVLLIGDASYDRRNYEGYGNWDMVPTKNIDLFFQETGSDEALADVVEPHDGLADIPIGRIPARTGQSVMTVLNKTMTFETPSNQSLARGALFAYDGPFGYDFGSMSHQLADQLPTEMPKVFVERGQPNAHQDLINAINTGNYIVNYSGHGSAGLWASSDFFGVNDVPSLTNASRPSLFTMLTCLNGLFLRPRPTDDSIGEALLKAPNGGAAMTWSSTTETTPDYQLAMGLEFFRLINVGQLPRLGDLIKASKMRIAGSDVGYSWVLLGDPTLKVR